VQVLIQNYLQEDNDPVALEIIDASKFFEVKPIIFLKYP